MDELCELAVYNVMLLYVREGGWLLLTITYLLLMGGDKSKKSAPVARKMFGTKERNQTVSL